MTTPPRIVQLTCPECSAVTVCGPADMISRLRAAGMLRREKGPDPDLVAALLPTAADRLICPQCGHLGMSVKPLEDEHPDEQWNMGRACEACGKPIPEERVELIPDVTLCVDCQRTDEAGGSGDEPEFCPRCGGVMTVRRRSGGGIAGYEMRCSECGRR